MFDIASTELLLAAIVALLVIGPKELPNALRTLGRFTGRARAMTRHLRSGFDEMMRQAEMEEMEKQWKEHNRRIMESAPAVSDFEIDRPAATGTNTAAGTNTGAPETTTPQTRGTGTQPDTAGDSAPAPDNRRTLP